MDLNYTSLSHMNTSLQDTVKKGGERALQLTLQAFRSPDNTRPRMSHSQTKLLLSRTASPNAMGGSIGKLKYQLRGREELDRERRSKTAVR